MKTKTNQEIMAELQTRGRFRTPEEVDKYFLEALEAKDEQARQEKIELVRSVPDYHIDGDSNGGSLYPYPLVKKWKTNKLTQLKNES